MHPWIWPDAPWQRVHIDFAGPFLHKMLLVVVDARTKWPEVVIMPDTTAEHTVDALQVIFATHGLPEQLVSDNGPQFTSQAFETFVKLNGIRHIRCSPYHPSSNGLAECFVRTFKEAMTASRDDGRSLQHRVSDFLLTYRSTPHATTAESPASLMFKRQIRTHFDLLRPSMESHVAAQQSQQKLHHDSRAHTHQLSVGDVVLARDFLHQPKWKKGQVLMQLGPLTYIIKLNDGRQWKRHIDHLKPFISNSVDPHKDPTTPTVYNDQATVPTMLFHHQLQQCQSHGIIMQCVHKPAKRCGC
jgi:hypothetical protein